jgi:hypothetical protein
VRYLLVEGLEEEVHLLVLGTELLQHRGGELGLHCTYTHMIVDITTQGHLRSHA